MSSTLRYRPDIGSISGLATLPTEYDEETQLPPTYVVLKMAPDIHEKALQWLTGKIRAKRSDGGGELVIIQQPNTSDREEYTFHVSATKIKLLEVAEEIELIKTDSRGQPREFSVVELDEFLANGRTIDDLLTLSDRQTIVLHELENIRALDYEKFIPGYPLLQLYEGQAIVPYAKNKELIVGMYPLHDEEHLKKLAGTWYMPRILKQPIDDIRQYFGESIALYFAFLEYYTLALAVPAVLGLIGTIFSETVPFFCAFNVIWVTLFLELWKRRSNELAYKWGTIGMTSVQDEPRPGFRGAMGIDAVTGKVCPQSPRYITYLKMYCVSLPIVMVCMLLAFYLVLVQFWIEDYLKTIDLPNEYLIMVPGIVYSILVPVITLYFKDFAAYLTEWENHRTQSQFERHWVTKLVLFEFVNNFVSLFYIAFVLRDINMLRSQLQTMLIISQAMANLQEVFVPLGMNFYKIKSQTLRQKPYKKSNPGAQPEKASSEGSLPLLNIPQLQPDDPRIKQAQKEGDMEEYLDTYDDYLELYIQFGFVFLFSSVYPIAAFWALLNNVLEIRADAFKLCSLFRRPFVRKVKDIGAWQRSFEVLGGLSILTNCAVLYLSPDFRNRLPHYSDVELLILLLCLEQALVGVRYLLHIAISDKPEWVKVALAKKSYLSKQALKFERTQRNRKILYRFRTVPDTGRS